MSKAIGSAITIAGFVLVLLVPRVALAHWCDDLWASSYNIALHPATDTISVPDSGSVDLEVWVQNNMGYPLKNFTMEVDHSGGFSLSVSRDVPTVSGYLMPGEKLRYIIAISRSGGGSVSVEELTFFIRFGDGSQSRGYGDDGRHVMVRKTDGSLYPSSAPGLGEGSSQALHLRYSASADYGDLSSALDNLLQEYCSGRRSWDHNNTGVSLTYCPDATTTSCSSAGLGNDTKWDWQKLWAAHELAYRKDYLEHRLATFRDRLECGWDDTHFTFKALAGFVLGYLGEDAGARAFLEGQIADGDANEEAVAKAALLLMGNPADLTAYGADVTAGLSSPTFQVAEVSAAALGIVHRDDDIVTDYLLPRSSWSCPGGCDSSDDNGAGYLGAHLLALVAWDRRGWAPGAADTGTVSFYGDEVEPGDETDPVAPAGVTCTPSTGGDVRVSWSAVTVDVSGMPETIARYRVFGGASARPGGVTDPADGGFSYDSDLSTTALARDFESLDGTRSHYFAVSAIDAAGNESLYSTEVDCLPRYAPLASISCSPTGGVAPLEVTCQSSGSSDPNGSGDIVRRAFSLDGAADEAAVEVTYNFAEAGGHEVVLTVTDSTDLSDSDNASITVTTETNAPPTAVATATPTTGQAPLAVSFNAADSSDPDAGQTLSFAWDFRDGATSTAQSPTHTFASAGNYSVLVTVTDNGTPPASSIASVDIDVQGNHAPDVTGAAAAPTTGTLPLTVTFDASAVSDPDGNSVSVTWSFGDDTRTSSDVSVEHVYSAAGTYTAVLTASDDGTPAVDPATRSFAITVSETPAENRAPDCSAATVSPLSGRAPLTVTLDASGCTDPDGDQMSYLWRVGTSVTTEETFTDAVTTYTFTEQGDFPVHLAVTDLATSPRETGVDFAVSVQPASDELGNETGPDLVGGCALVGASAPTRSRALLALLCVAAPALARRRRRRRRR